MHEDVVAQKMVVEVEFAQNRLINSTEQAAVVMASLVSLFAGDVPIGGLLTAAVKSRLCSSDGFGELETSEHPTGISITSSDRVKRSVTGALVGDTLIIALCWCLTYVASRFQKVYVSVGTRMYSLAITVTLYFSATIMFVTTNHLVSGTRWVKVVGLITSALFLSLLVRVFYVAYSPPFHSVNGYTKNPSSLRQHITGMAWFHTLVAVIVYSNGHWEKNEIANRYAVLFSANRGGEERYGWVAARAKAMDILLESVLVGITTGTVTLL
eukprot:PhF_6_TR13620/c1_g1_i1/m.21803